MVAEKVTSVAGYSGTATAVVTGGAVQYFGMTPTSLSVLFGGVGALVAVIGLIGNLWFKWQHLKIAQAAAQADPEV